jgi:hypothetical protein
LSFQYLLEYFRRTIGTDSRVEARLTSHYTQQWSKRISPERIEKASAAAPLVAVFAYAAGNETWLDQQRLQNPQTAGYLRALTRRMSREAKHLSDRGVQCAS